MTTRRARVLLCSSLLVCASGWAAVQPPPAGVSPTPLTAAGYAEEVQRWSVQLTKARDQPEDIAQLHRQVPPDWPVAVDGQVVRVRTDWLRSGLENADKNPTARAQTLDRLLARLNALRHEAQALAEERPGPDASAAGKLRAILARPEFRQVHGPTWLERLAQWVDKWLRAMLDRLAGKLSGHERVAGLMRLLPWALLIGAAGVLLVWMVRLLLRRSAARLVEMGIPQPVPAPSWRQMAEAARKAATAGEYREAIRLAYLSAIHRLEYLKVWSVDPARTHREYLRMIRPEQPAHEPLALITREFELTWYGSQPATPAGFAMVADQLERLGCT